MVYIVLFHTRTAHTYWTCKLRVPLPLYGEHYTSPTAITNTNGISYHEQILAHTPGTTFSAGWRLELVTLRLPVSCSTV